MQEKKIPVMDRESAYAVLKRHDGSISEVARDLQITLQAVSQWLRGEIIEAPETEEACFRKAQNLLDYEAKLKKAGLHERP